MQISKVLVLSLEEARDILAASVADAFINDRDYFIESVKDGNLKNDLFDARSWTALQIADRVAELNLAEEWGINAGVDQVYMDLGDMKHETYSCLWDIENLDSDRRTMLKAGRTHA